MCFDGAFMLFAYACAAVQALPRTRGIQIKAVQSPSTAFTPCSDGPAQGHHAINLICSARAQWEEVILCLHTLPDNSPTGTKGLSGRFLPSLLVSARWPGPGQPPQAHH